MYYHGSPISPMSQAQPHPHPQGRNSPHHQSFGQAQTPSTSRMPQVPSSSSQNGWMYQLPIPPPPGQSPQTSRYPTHPDDRSAYGYSSHPLQSQAYRQALAQERREGEYPQFRGQHNPFYLSQHPGPDGISPYERSGVGQNGYVPYEDRARWTERERDGERWRREEVGGGYREENRR